MTATAWLSVIGLGERGQEDLTTQAKNCLDNAELLVGGHRHLSLIQPDNRPHLLWRTSLDETCQEIAQWRGKQVCILATNDPFCYGIGKVLRRHFSLEEMTIFPAPSAFSLACARLGWSLEEIDTLSLHGRPISLLYPVLQPNNHVLLLTENRHTPQAVARLLCLCGFGASQMIVLEHLGGLKERRQTGIARTWNIQDHNIADLHVLALVCLPDETYTTPLPCIPGLPDHVFSHDGNLTKREVRAVTLAMLAPSPGHLLWDIGAGCGSISVEWVRSNPRCRAVAVERQRSRLALIESNRERLGCPYIEILHGTAPQCLTDLKPPNAIFIGGGLTDTQNSKALLQTCWSALLPHGRMVINAVTVQAEHCLVEWFERHGGTLTRLQTTRATPLGIHTAWKPLRPVTQYTNIKHP